MIFCIKLKFSIFQRLVMEANLSFIAEPGELLGNKSNNWLEGSVGANNSDDWTEGLVYNILDYS